MTIIPNAFFFFFDVEKKEKKDKDKDTEEEERIQTGIKGFKKNQKENIF